MRMLKEIIEIFKEIVEIFKEIIDMLKEVGRIIKYPVIVIFVVILLSILLG